MCCTLAAVLGCHPAPLLPCSIQLHRSHKTRASAGAPRRHVRHRRPPPSLRAPPSPRRGRSVASGLDLTPASQPGRGASARRGARPAVEESADDVRIALPGGPVQWCAPEVILLVNAADALEELDDDVGMAGGDS
eukprot:CAMPEP_0115485374 /NCGR_PEP_ID=MMETSP0271-20121206/59882_1 /TAXON_ID=71861 /ORGANISM="Scrippsiella trochoidea, Strain CCMP3099" /LENGTH=134 /DNA_ID=CAMNT_0002913341 /DNA_START=306 /DNA_END=707 /DNA_ORIENTATION=-